MFTSAYKAKVFYSVIKFIFIDMVNEFAFFKRSTEMFFHNKTMFKNRFFVNLNISHPLLSMNPAYRRIIFHKFCPLFSTLTLSIVQHTHINSKQIFTEVIS